MTTKTRDRGQGEEMESLMFPGDATSPTPSFGLWDEIEDNGKFSSLKRKHDDTLSDELLTMLKDAGLENMALEVGTVQGGQIAALQDGKEGGLGSAAKMLRPFAAAGDATSPVAMTASAIFSPNPRGTAPPLDSPLLLKRSLGSPAPPMSMTASAIFSPNPRGHRVGVGGGALSHLTESPAAIKGTDLRQAASAESDSPPKSKPKKSRRTLPPATAAPPTRDIPPPEPVPPPPAGRTRRACTHYGADAPSDTALQTKRTKKPEAKPNKGLRHFSVKVCRKVEEKGTTTYNEVADELVQELAAEGKLGTGKEPHYDDKNIRRRVYDALNVLMAIDIISKDRKEIKWKGLPENSSRSGLRALQQEKQDRERSLDAKKSQLADLLVQQISFRNLARRNRSRAAARAAAAAAAAAAGNGAECAEEQDAEEVAASKIFVPFIVVSSSHDTVIQCEMAENREDVFFNFSHEFQIADDNEILKRLGMHKCRKQDLPVLLARELIPRVPPEVYSRDDAEGSPSSSSTPSSPTSSCSDYSPT
ncbi:unnamed protein product [Ectocarpus sp. 6 AP-2014]